MTHDEVYDLDREIGDYFRAGVRRVWVINPEQKTVRVHRGPGDLVELLAESELSEDAVLPGFRCRLSSIFTRPPTPQP